MGGASTVQYATPTATTTYGAPTMTYTSPAMQMTEPTAYLQGMPVMQTGMVAMPEPAFGQAALSVPQATASMAAPSVEPTPVETGMQPGVSAAQSSAKNTSKKSSSKKKLSSKKKEKGCC